MEASTIIHDEEKYSNGIDLYVYLGDGINMYQSDFLKIKNITDDRALYPSDLVNDILETAITLPSLTRLCCARIAKEARFLEEDACTRLPVNLYSAILREAIRNEFRKIAFILMPIWPLKVISMIDVVPGVLNYFAVLAEDRFMFEHGARGIIRLVRLFLYVVKNRLTPHLRVLDLRGVASRDTMIKFLVGEIISISRNVSLLDDYCIFIDCEIRDSNVAEELINFLKTRDTKIHLHINKLNVTWLCTKEIWELLEQISPNELFGLKLMIDCRDMTSSLLTKFSGLIALDLQVMQRINNGVNEAVSTLPLFPQLRRLSFNNYSIDVVPKSTLRQLEYLNIPAGRPVEMTEINLRHLISALPLRLTEVILRGCEVIANHLHLWKTFLLSIASTLKMLDLRGCFEYDDVHFAAIWGYILPSVNLVFLDLSRNSLSNETLHEHVPKLNSLPRLKKVVLPKYPTLNCRGNDDGDYGKKLVFRRYRVLEGKMLIGRQNPIRIQWD